MNNRIEATRKLLKIQGEKPEEIEQILKIIQHSEKEKSNDSLRSWFAIVISIISMLVSAFFAYLQIINN